MAENNDKGKLLEEIVAHLYFQDDYKVEKNKFFKPLNTNKRKREIDVLLSKTIAGSKVYIPIECKNHKNRISVNEIDAFAGKLNYLGLSSKNAIFISVNGFTSGARDNAEHFGIKLFTIKGLSKDRKSLELLDAIQSFTYVFPIFKSYSIVNSLVSNKNYEHLIFYDSKRKLKGTLVDIVYELWMTGKIDFELGLQKINIENANELFCFQNDKFHQCVSIEFEILIIACIINFKGKMTKQVLLDDKNIDKLKINANFDRNANLKYIFFDNENSLEEYKKNKNEELRIDFRKIKLPKIRMHKIFYPLSKKVIHEYNKFLVDKDEEKFNQEIEFIEKDLFNSIWD